MVIQEPWSSRNIFRRRYRPKGRHEKDTVVKQRVTPPTCATMKMEMKVNKLVPRINSVPLCQTYALYALKWRLKAAPGSRSHIPQAIIFAWPISTITVSLTWTEKIWNRNHFMRPRWTFAPNFYDAIPSLVKLFRHFWPVLLLSSPGFGSNYRRKYLSGRAWDWI